jgi:DNA-binding response OmpR family regulator
MNTASDKSRILVVDDDENVLQLLAEVLCSMGQEVVSAKSGEEALKEAARSVFDLCILDIEMPGLNGLQVCRRLRATPHTASLPILILTSGNNSTTIHEAFDAGASDFLSKPIIPKLLWNRVTILLRISELLRETQRLNEAVKCLCPPQNV